MKAVAFANMGELINALNGLAERGEVEGFCVRDEEGRPAVVRSLDGRLLPERFTMSAAPWVARWSKSGVRLVAFLLPCETASLVELAKLKQAELENLVVVSSVCRGLPDKDGAERAACEVCTRRVAEWSDLHLEMEDGVVLAAGNEKGEELLRAMGGRFVEWNPPEFEDGFRDFVHRKQAEIRGWDGLARLFSRCILCLNCMRVCPVCACPHCYFESKEAGGSGALWRQRIEAGAVDFGREVMWFHLGRAYHVALLCVGCGLCGDACPVGVDVFGFFAVASSAAQARFGYRSGRDPQEPLPLAVYQEEEFEDVGQGGKTA